MPLAFIRAPRPVPVDVEADEDVVDVTTLDVEDVEVALEVDTGVVVTGAVVVD